MKSRQDKTTYFFVDESGDSTFYNKHGKFIVGAENGSSKILMLGFIRTENPKSIRSAILELNNEIKNDAYLRGIPSIGESVRAFHARGDSPEVKEKFFKRIVNLDFKAEFVVARKIESLFKNKYQGKESLFYNDLIVKLFKDKLHTSQKNIICFSARGNHTRQEPLSQAIAAARFAFEQRWGTKIDTQCIQLAQTPSGEPCLQIIDYMNWAVQRAFIKGDDRYLKFVQKKISFIVDVFDFNKYPRNYYKGKDFEINKISPP